MKNEEQERENRYWKKKKERENRFNRILMGMEPKTDKFTAAWMDRCHELEMEVVGLKQRKLVRREFVEEWLEENWDERWCWHTHYKEIMEWLIKMLKAIGVEMED